MGLRERSEWSLPLYQPDAAKSSMPQLPNPLVRVLKTSGVFTGVGGDGASGSGLQGA